MHPAQYRPYERWYIGNYYYVYAKRFMISWKREIKFASGYATRPNSCILSISADRDAGLVEKGVSDN